MIHILLFLLGLWVLHKFVSDREIVIIIGVLAGAWFLFGCVSAVIGGYNGFP